jgi:hypothetical protein
MRVTHLALPLFVGQASLALATPIRPFAVQEPGTPLTVGGFCDRSGSPPRMRALTTESSLDSAQAERHSSVAFPTRDPRNPRLFTDFGTVG